MNWLAYFTSRVAATLPLSGEHLLALFQDDRVTKARLADVLAAAGAGRNLLIGGNFSTNPFQRGTASLVATSGAYVADRWRVEFDGAPTITRDVVDVAVGSKVLGVTVRKALKITVTNKAAATYIRLGQRIEGVTTVTNAKAVLSTAVQGNKAMTVPVRCVQCFGTGGAPSPNVVTGANSSLAVTANMTEMYTDIDVPSIAGKVFGTTANTDYLEIQYDLSNLGTGDYVIIPLSQLERASWPSPFEQLHVQRVLQMCQRYYETALYQVLQGAVGTATPTASIQFHVKKRVIPTLTIKSIAGTVGKWSSNSLDIDDGAYKRVDIDSILIGPSASTYANNYAACYWMVDAEFNG